MSSSTPFDPLILSGAIAGPSPRAQVEIDYSMDRLRELGAEKRAGEEGGEGLIGLGIDGVLLDAAAAGPAELVDEREERMRSARRGPRRASKQTAVDALREGAQIGEAEESVEALEKLQEYDDPDHLDEKGARKAGRRNRERIKSESKARERRLSGLPPAPKRKDAVRGRLAKALTCLPNEILHYIWSLCDARTILNFSRASSDLHRFFHSKSSSQSIWRQAWRNSGLEHAFVAEGWNEPMYAALVWDRECDKCGVKVSSFNLDFRARICKKCIFLPPHVPSKSGSSFHRLHSDLSNRHLNASGSKRLTKLTVDSQYAMDITRNPPFAGKEFIEEVLQCVTTSRYHIQGRGGGWLSRFCLQSSIIELAGTVHRLVQNDIEETERRLEAGEPVPDIEIPDIAPGVVLSAEDVAWRGVPGTVGVYLREQRRLIELASQDTQELARWEHMVGNEEHKKNSAGSRERAAEMKRRLMEDHGFSSSTVAWAFSQRSPIYKNVHASHPCTDRVWKKISPVIIETVQAYELIIDHDGIDESTLTPVQNQVLDAILEENRHRHGGYYRSSSAES